MLLLGLVIGIIVLAIGWKVFKKKKPVFLRGGDVWLKVMLIDKKILSHDSKLFIFGLPQPDLPLGLPLGSHILFRAKIESKAHPEGEIVIRKYTPTSPHDEVGKIELPIKIYYKNTHPAFPEGGLMTQYLDSLNIGDSIDISGPKGRLKYHGFGKFQIQDNPIFTVKELGLIAGGTGITPCFQLIQYILDVEKGSLNIYLIYANKTESDILLRERLENYQKTKNLKLFYTLDQPDKDWKYGSGFVSEQMVAANMPGPQSALIAFCGPPPMCSSIQKHTKALGYQHAFKF